MDGTSNGGVYYYGSGTTSTSLVWGTWFHFVITDLGISQVSPPSNNVYIDASLEGSGASTDWTGSISQKFYIGGAPIYPHNPDFRDCTIDEVAVWRNHALSAVEAAAIYNQGGPNTPGDLENPGGAFTKPDSYWRCGDLDDTDGGGGIIYDRIGPWHMTAGDPGGNGSGAPLTSTDTP